MVRPIARRFPTFTAPALAVAALGFVGAGVLLGTGGIPNGEPRDPAPVLTRPAAQVVLPGPSTPIIIESAGDSAASDPNSPDAGTYKSPTSALDPQLAPASGSAPGGGNGADGGDGSAGNDPVAGILPPPPDGVPPVTQPPPPEDPIIDLGPIVDPLLEPLGGAS